MSNQQEEPNSVGRATGFELRDSGDHAEARGIDSALERNRAFAAAAGHEGAVVFPTLQLFVITCLDPRTDPAHFLGLGMSDAMVVRNVGGRVTPEVINDVAYIGQLAETIMPDGPLFEVAVIHHTQCGTGALADDTFRRRYAERIGADESSLREHAVLDPAATVTRDVDLPARGALDLPARNGVRPRLRRGHRPGGDGPPCRWRAERASSRSVGAPTPLPHAAPPPTRVRLSRKDRSGDLGRPAVHLVRAPRPCRCLKPTESA